VVKIENKTIFCPTSKSCAVIFARNDPEKKKRKEA
jgi:hypothetical protein